MHIASFKELFAYAKSTGMGTKSTTALERFYFRCRLLGCNKKTQAVYAERLGYLLKYAKSIDTKIEALTNHDLQRYVDSLIDSVSPVTINGRIQAYRVFFRHLIKEGFIEADPMTGIEKVKQPKGRIEAVGPQFNGVEAARLFAGR